MSKIYDVAILGGGASGLMFASELSSKYKAVLIDANKELGAKIAVSGGGRCNLTNVDICSKYYRGDSSFISSILNKYNNRWLIDWFAKRGAKCHIQKRGQYFCIDKSVAIIEALKSSIKGVKIAKGTSLLRVEAKDEEFKLIFKDGNFLIARTLVVASGGLSFPKLGASSIGLDIAKRTGHNITKTSPALVGFTLQPEQNFFKTLSGISIEVKVIVGDRCWEDYILFAHRGLSGPAILNASLWWERGKISIDFIPHLKLQSIKGAKKNISTLLKLPKRVSKALLEHLNILDRPCYRLRDDEWNSLERLHNYSFAPAGTFGYSKAEVTSGGVSTKDIDVDSMQSKRVKGLYFIGEVVDVTGELGGYNFQWVFSSAKVCADYINKLCRV